MSELSDIENQLGDVFDSPSSDSDEDVEENDNKSEETDEESNTNEAEGEKQNSEVVDVEDVTNGSQANEEVNNNCSKSKKLFYQSIELFPSMKATSEVWKYGGQ